MRARPRDRVTRESTPPTLGLGGGYGLEIEWAIVDRETADPRPYADRVLVDDEGGVQIELDRGAAQWSNELALHVLEAKTAGPVPSLKGMAALFTEQAREMNERLRPFGACLMGGGAHPFMEPRHAMLWPHEQREIYAAYDRIFDCRSHGWVNAQSLHLNLPFDGDEELARLHDAVRLVLPIMPALSAASPFLDGRRGSYLDARADASRDRHRRIREIGGQVIPEPIETRDEYERVVLFPMYRAVEPYDPEQLLQAEWLNSRGAVLRFDRSALEIRVLDAQESPVADVAVAAAVSAIVEALADRRLSNRLPERSSTERLAAIFDNVARDADQAVIRDAAYLRVFGVRRTEIRAGELWEHLLRRFAIPREHEQPIQTILKHGPLARRLLDHFGRRRVNRERLVPVCQELSACLEEGRMFIPSR